MTNLHNGRLDQASRAAAAILAVHRGCSPKQIGPGLDAVLMVDLDFSATSRRLGIATAQPASATARL